MGIKITTDVFCGKCSNWRHFWTDAKSRKTEALKVAKRSGWKVVKEGEKEVLICPCCTGEHPDYWYPDFPRKKGQL